MAQTDFSDMSDTGALRKTLGHFPTGVAIATTMTADNKPTGLTISSFNSVSLAPPLILFSIDLQATCLADFRQNDHFAINILSAEQTQLCTDFATPDIPRFDGAEFSAWLMQTTPQRRWGQVDDLVGAAIFLASPASDFVNGQILYVDGGMTASV